MLRVIIGVLRCYFSCIYIYKSILGTLYFDLKKTHLLLYACIPLVFELAVDLTPVLVSPWKRCLV